MLISNMPKQQITTPKNTRLTIRQTTQQTSETPLSQLRTHLDLRMTLRQKHPAIPYPRVLVRMHVGVDGVWFRAPEESALEVALFALPDCAGGYHTGLEDLFCQAGFPGFADRPGAFAEAPVVVAFCGAAD